MTSQQHHRHIQEVFFAMYGFLEFEQIQMLHGTMCRLPVGSQLSKMKNTPKSQQYGTGLFKYFRSRRFQSF